MTTKLVVSQKTVIKWVDGSPQLHVPPYNKKVFDCPISILSLFLDAFESPRELEEVISEFDNFERKDVENAISNLRAVGALETVPCRCKALDDKKLQKIQPNVVRFNSNNFSLKSSHSVLLFGPLVGQEAMGLTYIASFLRRHDIEVHLINTNPIDNAGARLQIITKAINYYKPTLVGVSLKWYHHIGRALEICQLVREADPNIQIVIGGNSATQFWRELITYDCVDNIVLGDGEVPMLDLARRYRNPQNCVSKKNGTIVPGQITFVESEKESTEIYLSHLDQIYTSQLDIYGGTGWFYLGKGCSHNCLYCAGCQDIQEKVFCRKKPFYREKVSIQKDLEEIFPYQQTFRMDFDDRSCIEISHFFEEVISDFNLSEHGLHYYAWGLPDDRLLQLLSESFDHTFVAIDTCTFSERQRLDIAHRGLSKPLPTNDEILAFLASADGLSNMTVMLNAIAGLPYQKECDHKEACAFIRSALKYKSLIEIECLLLEWQPGALISDNPEQFGYARQFKEFDDYVNHFQKTVDRPRLRFIDEEKNRRIETELNEITELMGDRTSRSLQKLPAGDFFSLKDVRVEVRPGQIDLDTTLAKWLGKWRTDTDALDKSLLINRSSARGMEGSGYIEHTVDEEHCFIYGNHTRELNSSYKSYGSNLLKSILIEIQKPNTINKIYESIRREQKVSHIEFMKILIELSRYGFINAN